MSAMATAHEMNNSRVKPDWPALRLEEVRALLAQFEGRSEPLEILSVSPRPFSAASVVSTREGCVFNKRHHATVRDRDGLLEEHRFLNHLWDAGVSVPKVYASLGGETAIVIGEWTYEVHEAIVGSDPNGNSISWTPFPSTAHAHTAGRALGRLHQASKSFAAPARKLRPLVASFTIFAAKDAEAAAAEYIATRPALADYLGSHRDCDDALEELAPFHRELQALLPALEPLWTQNDLDGSNLLWSDGVNNAHLAAIIDFGLADRTYGIHDLAHAIDRNIVDWDAMLEDPAHPENVAVHFEHLQAMLTGYDAVNPLTPAEAAALAPMAALCHVEFALSEADYFLDALHSPERARMATEDYLLGHARWFRSPSGGKLMDAIDRWAEGRNHSRLHIGHQRVGEP